MAHAIRTLSKWHGSIIVLGSEIFFVEEGGVIFRVD